jgi:signal transduction histidine kinase
MSVPLNIRQLVLRSKRLLLLVIGLTLAILAGAIGLATWQVRAQIRAQIAGRDGEVLYAVALMQAAAELAAGWTDSLAEPEAQLAVVLKTAQLKGVMGARLFNPQGQFVESFPPELREAPLEADLPRLAAFRPSSRFLPAVRLSSLFYPETAGWPSDDPPAPVLEINVPLHAPPAGPLLGIAQFLVEGNSLAGEYARLDRMLAWQAGAAFLAGGSALVLALTWAFRRLRQAHHQLAERTEDLIKANQELALAAKTSALGAVTAHLIHGLKNPLAGLQNFVTTHGATTAELTDWAQAAASMQRMQGLVNQVLSVLREEQTGLRYELTLAELGEMVCAQVQPWARERGVNFESHWEGAAVLPNRTAHLLLLILVNLVQNALQASPPGKKVTLTALAQPGRASRCGEPAGRARPPGAPDPPHITFEVQDEGPGLPPDLPLFVPCRSTKPGGSGIGLALSKQLANHLGATLELKSNTPCVFALTVPLITHIKSEASHGAPLSAAGD